MCDYIGVIAFIHIGAISVSIKAIYKEYEIRLFHKSFVAVADQFSVSITSYLKNIIYISLHMYIYIHLYHHLYQHLYSNSHNKRILFFRLFIVIPVMYKGTRGLLVWTTRCVRKTYWTANSERFQQSCKKIFHLHILWLKCQYLSSNFIAPDPKRFAMIYNEWCRIWIFRVFRYCWEKAWLENVMVTKQHRTTL